MAPMKAMKPMKGMKVATAGLKTTAVKAVTAPSRAQLIFCNGRCQATRPDYQFLEEALLAVMAGTDQPQQRMCVHCYMQGKKDLSEAKEYKCPRT